MTRQPLAAALALAALATPVAVHAQASDPGAQTVERFDAALLSAMKSGGGAQGRFTRLLPAAQQAFDFPTMTRVAVGPQWTSIPAAQQQQLVTAFARFTAASFAKNFGSYDGERFTVDPAVQTRGVDKLVKSQLIGKSGSPTDFTWRMRQAGGQWKIVDVFYNGAISQLASQRSDFQSTLASGGAGALVKKLDGKTETLLKG
ncbi:MAG: ABC transporter substrate-binding protein [Caulobacteraceae bacterium]|nr:ABC transporter substrate-binding protein [Caulobacter sp.]